ncbi:MAG: type II toxin-antitoxin system VapB family antitoxin [Acidobacteriia bacterium]|nr:type II toxin-antitoxin system VapB family antitoxin [Terriglobia bacterium]
MALNIKNPEVEKLAGEVARMAKETKTEAVRKALSERKERLLTEAGEHRRRGDWLEFLEREVWPNIPEGERGRTLTREEEDEILGYGPDGV